MNYCPCMRTVFFNVLSSFLDIYSKRVILNPIIPLYLEVERDVVILSND
jgi:hypothetical protein